MSKFEIVKLEVLEVDGPYRFEFVKPDEYTDEIRPRWARDEKIVLPDFQGLKKMGDPRDVRILLNPITVTVTFKNSALPSSRARFNSTGQAPRSGGTMSHK